MGGKANRALLVVVVSVIGLAPACAFQAPREEVVSSTRVAATGDSAELPEAECRARTTMSELSADFKAALFPFSSTNDAIARSYQSAAPVTHTSLLARPAITPTIANCASGRNGATLQLCYEYASYLTLTALNAGSAYQLLEAAVRTRDVVARAEKDPEAPAWLKSKNATNPLYSYFVGRGIPLDTNLGACTSGSADTRYGCVASTGKPGAQTWRNIIGALDHHNGVLVRFKTSLSGAANRELNIWKSTTAPLAMNVAQTGCFGPRTGPGVQHVEVLAKHFAIQLSDETAAAREGQEVDYYKALGSYTPAGSNYGIYKAPLFVSAAAARAFGWDETLGTLRYLDPQVASDVAAFFGTLRQSIATAHATGNCALAQELNALYVAAGPTTFSRGFWRALETRQVCMQDSAEDLAGLGRAEIGSCDWTTFADVPELTVVYVTDTETETVWMSSCTVGDSYTSVGPSSHNDCGVIIAGEITACLRCIDIYSYDGRFDSFDCQDNYIATVEYPEYDCTGDGAAYWEMLDTAYNKPDVERQVFLLFVTRTVMRSLGEMYREVLTDTSGLTLDSSATASVASVAVSGGADVSTDPCMSEFDQTYGTETSASSTASSEYDYAVAARICPNYVASTLGVTRQGISECATPYAFVSAVASFLDDWQGMVTDGTVYGWSDDESFESVLTQFAPEAVLMTLPAASALRQQADVAYFTGDVTDASWASANTGLTNLGAKLEEADTILDAGATLVASFHALDATDTNGAALGAATILPESAEVAYAASETDSAMALYYKRIRDLITEYQSVKKTRFELIWRGMDDMLELVDGDIWDSSCDADWDGDCDADDGCDTDGDGVCGANGDGAVDNDGCDVDGDQDCDADDKDGVLDSPCVVVRTDGYVCASSAPECASFCALWQDAADLVSDANERLEGLASDMDAQAVAASAAPFVSYLPQLAALARSAQAGLSADWTSLNNGTNWLGYSSGRWFPGRVDSLTFPESYPCDPTDYQEAVDCHLRGITTLPYASSFTAFLDDYAARATEISEWNESLSTYQANVAAEAGNYCADEEDTDADATCGTDLEWSAAESGVITELNGAFTTFCTSSYRLYYFDADAGAFDPARDYDELEVADALADLDGDGAADCPQFVGPDFDDADGDTGTVQIALQAMEQHLRQVRQELTNLSAALDNMQGQSLAQAELQSVEYTKTRADENEQRVLAWVGCGLAVLGSLSATFVAAGCTVGTLGACGAVAAPTVIAAWGATAGICANAAGEQFDKVSDAEMQAAIADYQATLDQLDAEYQVATTLSSLSTTAFAYEGYVLQYVTLVADWQRLLAAQDTTFDALVSDPLFDATSLLFYESEIVSRKAEFRVTAEYLWQLRRLVQYDTGHAIDEGTDVGSHYLPPLAEVTRFSTYSETSFSTACSTIQQADPSSFELMGYGCVLQQAHDDFVALYGSRRPAADWLLGVYGVDPTSSDDEGGIGSQTEALLLGDSPFYDPSSNSAADCAVGEVDLSAYCSDVTETTPGRCFDPTTVDWDQRIGLAYADHMFTSAGYGVFRCTCDSTEGTCSVAVNVGSNASTIITTERDSDGSGQFDYAELGGTYGEAADGCTTDCYGNLVGGISQDYFDAQTPTVQALLEEYYALFGSDGEGLPTPGGDNTLALSELNVNPGSFLFALEMSAADFDVERDADMDGVSTTSSMAEHLTGLAILCADSVSCTSGEQTATDADAKVYFLGPARLGDSCYEEDGSTQERVDYRMSAGSETLTMAYLNPASDASSLDEQAASYVVDMGSRPLGAAKWLLSIGGVANSDGSVHDYAFTPYVGLSIATDYDGDWTSAAYYARLSIYAEYDYYETEGESGGATPSWLSCQDSSSHI